MSQDAIQVSILAIEVLVVLVHTPEIWDYRTQRITVVTKGMSLNELNFTLYFSLKRIQQ